MRFSVANVVATRAALDHKRSDFDVFPEDYFLADRRGRVRGIRKAVLKSAALKECDIVRLEEFLPSVYASEKFKDVRVRTLHRLRIPPRGHA